MFILFSGHNLVLVATTAQVLKEKLASYASHYEKQYEKQRNSNSWFKQRFGSKENYVAQNMKRYTIFDITGLDLVESTYDFSTKLCKTDRNVTDQFFTFGENEIQVDEHVTAKVIKKGLKSYGLTVKVISRVNHSSTAPTPMEFKELYDKLARIHCRVDNYGGITLAPDSLDEYQVSPVYKTVSAIKFVE